MIVMKTMKMVLYTVSTRVAAEMYNGQLRLLGLVLSLNFILKEEKKKGGKEGNRKSSEIRIKKPLNV